MLWSAGLACRPYTRNNYLNLLRFSLVKSVLLFEGIKFITLKFMVNVGSLKHEPHNTHNLPFLPSTSKPSTLPTSNLHFHSLPGTTNNLPAV